jgi:hypothetical protein
MLCDRINVIWVVSYRSGTDLVRSQDCKLSFAGLNSKLFETTDSKSVTSVKIGLNTKASDRKASDSYVTVFKGENITLAVLQDFNFLLQFFTELTVL